MKRCVVLGSLRLLPLLIALPTWVLAQPALPKEGSGSVTGYYSATAKTLGLGGDQSRSTYESTGIVVNDAGQGFLHSLSVRCLGSLHVVKGEWDNEQTSCVAGDRDGDQLFWRATVGGGPGRATTGKATFAGGTGKYSGLTGGFDVTRIPLRPVAEGTTYTITKVKYTYRLP